MESLLTQSGTFIVDNGASTFIPLWNYMLENNALELLKASGRRIFVHCVVTGGQALADTLTGFARLAETATSGKRSGRLVRSWAGLHPADAKTGKACAPSPLRHRIIPRRRRPLNPARRCRQYDAANPPSTCSIVPVT